MKPIILKFPDLKDIEERMHVDVRNVSDWQSTGVAEGSLLIPLNELESRAHELKDRKNIIVNCNSGGRARIAFSVLARCGIDAKVLAEGTQTVT